MFTIWSYNRPIMATFLHVLRLSDLFHGFNLYWTFVLLMCCGSCNCLSLNVSDNTNKRSLLSSHDQQRFACSETTYVYNALSNGKGLPKLDSAKLPQTAITGDHLKICSQGFTCCTEEMEVRLVDESRKEYQKFVQDKIVGLSHTFESRTSKFDSKFRFPLVLFNFCSFRHDTRYKKNLCRTHNRVLYNFHVVVFFLYIFLNAKNCVVNMNGSFFVIAPHNFTSDE